MATHEAGALLREARRRSGLSQAELARRAGTTQSVVSAYESSARQPSLPTLARLIEATGQRFDIHLATVGRPRDLERGLGGRLRRHRREVLEIFTKYGLTHVRLFGSVGRDEETDESDIDFLVDVGEGIGLLTLARCQHELERLLGRPVDIVPARDLKPGVASIALSEAVPL